jgi:hypothetical protein
MNTETDKRRMYVERLMNRLQRQYVEQTPLPAHEDGKSLSLEQLQRLYHHIMSEGYGE